MLNQQRGFEFWANCKQATARWERFLAKYCVGLEQAFNYWTFLRLYTVLTIVKGITREGGNVNIARKENNEQAGRMHAHHMW